MYGLVLLVRTKPAKLGYMCEFNRKPCQVDALWPLGSEWISLLP